MAALDAAVRVSASSTVPALWPAARRHRMAGHAGPDAGADSGATGASRSRRPRGPGAVCGQRRGLDARGSAADATVGVPIRVARVSSGRGPSANRLGIDPAAGDQLLLLF